MPIAIVGIDCATQPSKTGLSRAVYSDGVLSIKEARIADRSGTVAQQVHSWLQETPSSLIALDSPLGWPAALGQALSGHKAGGRISNTPNKLFRRTTDEVVKERLGKSPLEVVLARP
jgi:predicted RNase H-like nuclease